MLAKVGVVGSFILACLLGFGGSVAAQTTPPSAQILTAADVSGVAVGAWTGSCGYSGPAESPSIDCRMSRADQGEGLGALNLQMDPIPPGVTVAAARAAWRPTVDAQVVAGSQSLRAVTGLGDEAYLVTGTGAHAYEAVLMFFAGGNSGLLQASINAVVGGSASATPDPVIGDRLVRLGQIALPRFEAQLGTVAGGPPSAPASTPSSDAIDWLTIEEVAQIYGGTWAGGCSMRPVAHIACSFADRPDDKQGIAIHLAMPMSAEQIPVMEAEWHTQLDDLMSASPSGAPGASSTEWQTLSGIGDVAYLHHPAGTGPTTLFALRQGASVQLDGTVHNGDAGLVEMARLIVSRFPVPGPAAPTALPPPTPVPTPTAAPTATPVPTPVPAPTPTLVTPSADQLLVPADLHAAAGGDWSGTCARVQRSVECQFSQSDGTARMTLAVEQPTPGSAIPVQTLDDWRTAVKDAAAATSAVETAVSGVGDEAYALTGVGADSLEFYANGVTGRMDVADSTPAVVAALPGLARIALSRAGVSPATPSPTPLPPQVTAPAPPPASNLGQPLIAAGPSDISLDPVVIATSAAAAVGVVLLIPFPSAVFNSTLEENYDEIRGWFRFRRRRRPSGESGEPAEVAEASEAAGPTEAGDARESASSQVVAAELDAAEVAAAPGPIDRFWSTRAGIVSFFLVSAVLYGFLDPNFGLTTDSLLAVVGILAALAVTSLAATATVRWTRERLNGERGTFRVLPATLLVALGCVLVTRITDFQPGYLYGVLAGLLFVTVIGPGATGREQALKSSAVAGVGMAAFVLLGLARALEGGAGATGLWRPIEVALSALIIGGIEGLLFGMLPLHGLPGAAVKTWNVRVWMLLLFLGSLGFLHLIVNPGSGYLVDSTRTPMFKAIALLVGFGAISMGLWAWFRYRPMDRLRARAATVSGSAAESGAAGGAARMGGPDPAAGSDSASDEDLPRA